MDELDAIRSWLGKWRKRLARLPSACEQALEPPSALQTA